MSSFFHLINSDLHCYHQLRYLQALVATAQAEANRLFAAVTVTVTVQDSPLHFVTVIHLLACPFGFESSRKHPLRIVIVALAPKRPSCLMLMPGPWPCPCCNCNCPATPSLRSPKLNCFIQRLSRMKQTTKNIHHYCSYFVAAAIATFIVAVAVALRPYYCHACACCCCCY